MHHVLYCWVIVQYYHCYFVPQITLVLAPSSTFRLIPMFFQHHSPFLSFFFLSTPLLLSQRYSSTRCSRAILYFFGPRLKSMISPRTPAYFCLKMVFTNRDLGTGCAHSRWCCTIASWLSQEMGVEYMYMDWSMGRHTSLFLYLSICIYVKRNHTDISNSRLPPQALF